MDISPAPEAVIELVACKCTRTCTALKCTCIQHGLKWSDMCKIRECDNQPVEDDLENVQDIADDDDFDSDLFFDTIRTNRAVSCLFMQEIMCNELIRGCCFVALTE